MIKQMGQTMKMGMREGSCITSDMGGNRILRGQVPNQGHGDITRGGGRREGEVGVGGIGDMI